MIFLIQKILESNIRLIQYNLYFCTFFSSHLRTSRGFSLHITITIEGYVYTWVRVHVFGLVVIFLLLFHLDSLVFHGKKSSCRFPTIDPSFFLEYNRIRSENPWRHRPTDPICVRSYVSHESVHLTFHRNVRRHSWRWHHGVRRQQDRVVGHFSTEVNAGVRYVRDLRPCSGCRVILSATAHVNMPLDPPVAYT